MLIIGCDFHTRYQQIAMMDESTGKLVERRLDHESGEAHAFYRDLQGPVRVGIESTGPLHWFERRIFRLLRIPWHSPLVSGPRHEYRHLPHLGPPKPCPSTTTATRPGAARNIVLGFSERKSDDASAVQQAKRHLKAAKIPPKTPILDRK